MCYRNGYGCCSCDSCESKNKKGVQFGMTETDLGNAIHVLETLAEFLGIPEEEGEENEIPPLMIAVRPGEAMQIITEEEAAQFLPGFGEEDVIAEAPDLDLVMSYNKDLIFTVEDRKYLDGPALFYAVDDEGDIVPLTISDLFHVKEMLKRRTVLVKEEGMEMPVISLD